MVIWMELKGVLVKGMVRPKKKPIRIKGERGRLCGERLMGLRGPKRRGDLISQKGLGHLNPWPITVDISPART